MQALCRSLDLILSRTVAFLDAISFSRIYGGRVAKQEQPDQWAMRVDAQFAELVETIWATEKMWRLQDRIDRSIQYGLRRPEPATRCQVNGENDR
jgi:hypothetical protein